MCIQKMIRLIYLWIFQQWIKYPLESKTVIRLNVVIILHAKMYMDIGCFVYLSEYLAHYSDTLYGLISSNRTKQLTARTGDDGRITTLCTVQKSNKSMDMSMDLTI